MTIRQQHDAAHRIAVRVLHLIAPYFSDKELQDFYRAVMPLIVEGIEEYDRRKRLEESRLQFPVTNVRRELTRHEATTKETPS